jgi:SHS2 domain-containing protein
MTGEFTIREHTADVAVEATGETMGAAFAAVADGLTAAMCDAWPDADAPDGGSTHEFVVGAEGPEAALYDYLDELIYERDVRSILPVDNEATVTVAESPDGESWHVDARYRGVPLEAVTAREIKAVTYSEMSLSETPDGWRAYVVFDV